MKKLFSAGAIALAVAAGTADAADLPSRKAPPDYIAPPIMSWTGLYVGLNAGGAFGGDGVHNSASDLYDNPQTMNGCPQYGPGPICGAITAPAPSLFGAAGAASAALNIPLNSSGFLGGGQIGYLWRFNGDLVAGVEADIQGTTLDGHGSGMGVGNPQYFGMTVATVETASKSLDYLGTARARLGYLVTPSLLAYATGGLAYGGAHLSTSLAQGSPFPTGGFIVAPALGQTSVGDTRVGWTVGGGGEWMFAPNWSVKAEYLYYDLGVLTTNGALGGVGGIFPVNPPLYADAVQSSTRFNGHVVRAGVNYHFNWAVAPVVAGY
jgi:outer membrane immunogenic protein